MTNTHDMQAALDALEGLPPTTTAAKLRSLYPVIEAKLAAGIQHAAIVEALREAGIEVSLATYKGTLQRLRKEARSATPSRPTTPAPAAAKAAPPSPDTGGVPGQEKAIRGGAAGSATTEKKASDDIPTHGPDGLPLTAKQKRERVADQFVPRGGTSPVNPRLQRLLKKDSK